MLSKIITKVNWRIITFLIEKGEASLSEIARETKTTKANVFHSLKELAGLDCVRKTIRGKTHVYRINFLSRYAKEIDFMILEEKQEEYNKKLKNIPIIVHSFLREAMKDNYTGSIFFGSSLNDSYKDIDFFIILEDRKKLEILEKKIKLIDSNLSPIFGSEKELKEGIENKDMLYKNILNGISFGFDAFALKYSEFSLRKQDIRERFIIGYREILSCLEFKEKEYVKNHLDKGVMDIVYAILNYFDFFPKNDYEALDLFRKNLNEFKPKNINDSIEIIKKYAFILN